MSRTAPPAPPGRSAFDRWVHDVYPAYWIRRSRYYGIDAYAAGLINLVRAAAPARVFELAIGNGYPIASELSAAGVQVTGCDISPLLVEACRKSVPEVVAYVGSYDSPVPPEAATRDFDVVYCFRSTWYFPDLHRAIRFLVGIARPGGTVMFDIMNSDSQWNQDELRRKRRRFLKTIAMNAVKGAINVVFPKRFMLDQVFGFREIMHSAADVEAFLTAEGLTFRRLARGEVEGLPASARPPIYDQKMLYRIDVPLSAASRIE